jgi:hypothetical protein
MYANLIPEEFQVELINLGDSSMEQSFRIGDICSTCFYLNAGTPKAQIYSAIGAFCGKPSRTVREYCSIAEFYSPETRRTYSLLSFSHFRFAYKFRDDNWREILEYAVNESEQYGRPATVDKLIETFSYNEEKETVIQRILKRLDSIKKDLYDNLTARQKMKLDLKFAELEKLLTELEQEDIAEIIKI